MTLEARSVSLSYGDGDQTTYAVQEVSTSFPERGFFGIMGPSGSGKSSLLYLLSGLKRPSSGEVLYESVALSSRTEAQRTQLRRKRFGFVFQQPYLLNYLTARENVLAAALPEDRDADRHVEGLLQDLNVAHLAKRYPTHLSGGERQRLIVARAMMNRPAIIFADEPTAALDQTNGHAVIEMLARYREQGAVIVVTHDPAVLASADRIYHLAAGRLDRVETLRPPADTESVAPGTATVAGSR